MPADNTYQGPPGLEGGFWELNNPLTPGAIRPCLAEAYLDRRPAKADYKKVAVRLADDLRRRGCPRQEAERLVWQHLETSIPLVRPEERRQVAAMVGWVYEKMDHPVSCSPEGALAREGLCFRSTKRCAFYEELEQIRASRVAAARAAPTLPGNWSAYIAGVHPTRAIWMGLVYQELAQIEAEHLLEPGNPDQPIFVSFRTLSSRVQTTASRSSEPNRARGLCKDSLVELVCMLENVGLIAIVERGRAGRMNRKANGYIRVIPPPPPPGESASTAPPAAAEPPPAAAEPPPPPHTGHTYNSE